MKIKANISFEYDSDVNNYDNEATPYDMVLLDLESDPPAFFEEIYATGTLKVEAEIAQEKDNV